MPEGGPDAPVSGDASWPAPTTHPQHQQPGHTAAGWPGPKQASAEAAALDGRGQGPGQAQRHRPTAAGAAAAPPPRWTHNQGGSRSGSSSQRGGAGGNSTHNGDNASAPGSAPSAPGNSSTSTSSGAASPRPTLDYTLESPLLPPLEPQQQQPPLTATGPSGPASGTGTGPARAVLLGAPPPARSSARAQAALTLQIEECRDWTAVEALYRSIRVSAAGGAAGDAGGGGADAELPLAAGPGAVGVGAVGGSGGAGGGGGVLSAPQLVFMLRHTAKLPPVRSFTKWEDSRWAGGGVVDTSPN